MSGTRGNASEGDGVGDGCATRSVAKISSSMHKDSSAAGVASLPGCQSNSLVLSSEREGNWTVSVAADCAILPHVKLKG